MTHFAPNHELLVQAVDAAYAAGQAILRLYADAGTVEYKTDHSPLTAADRAAHAVIVAALRQPPGYRVLSEEGVEMSFAERASWPRFWLVDPLDGTKEFLKRNGEFTVNIALVENGVSILGVVVAPVPGTVYAGIVGVGAWKAEAGQHYRSPEELLAGARDPGTYWRRLPLAETDSAGVVRVVASRSHLNDDTRAFIAGVEARHGAAELVSTGSSLKLCLIAEGTAEVYPRLAPTMEWDTAAGQAVVEAAGGTVMGYGTGERVRYNKPTLLNPFFVARRCGWSGVANSLEAITR
jgi:3'(2'), 5'-bisphosphate nucleotidase